MTDQACLEEINTKKEISLIRNSENAVSKFLGTARLQVGRRTRQVSEILKNEGHRGFTVRTRKVVSDWIRPRAIAWPVLPADVLAADLSQPYKSEHARVSRGEPISVNWVTGPAGPGSGGHTTNYRIIKYLSKLGYVNRVYFYDPIGVDHKYYADIAREYYGLTCCPIANISDGMEDAHAVVATSWPSAYAVFNARCAGKRFYFVQDYEPYFVPVGANSIFAENTYRMGFHAITAGQWLARKLSREFDMKADYFPFGCDTSHYRLDLNSNRSGVAFYARAETPRRGIELGLLALEIFAKRQPSVELHFYGEKLGDLPFRYTNHGVVTPSRLNEIYNQCFAGLTLSLTNVSLVPYEMLAAGCIPVVNEADHNRTVLDNPYVRYAAATPHALAGALEDILNSPNFKSMSARGAQSVASKTWDDAGAAVDAIFRRALQT